MSKNSQDENEAYSRRRMNETVADCFRQRADFPGEDKAILQDVALLYRQAYHR